MSYSEIKLAASAKSLREEAGIDQYTPISDMRAIVKDLGHELSEHSFDDDFSATCFHIHISKFAIILNLDCMWNKNFERFTLAHELAHTYLPEHWAEMERQGGQLKTKAEFQSDKKIEREADIFAVNFLAPQTLFLKLSEGYEFDKEGLKEICNKLGVSLLTGAFRFIRLTDLCCSLIVVDNSTQKIKYEFRSKLMKDYNRHESITGWYIPPQGLVSRVLCQTNSFDYENEEVDISEYYPNYRKGLLCKESVFKMSYNNSTVVMLSALDDIEDYYQ